MSKVELSTKKVELLMKKVKLLTSKVELSMSKVELLTSKVELSTKKVELLMKKVELLTSKVELSMKKVELSTNNIEHYSILVLQRHMLFSECKKPVLITHFNTKNNPSWYFPVVIPKQLNPDFRKLSRLLYQKIFQHLVVYFRKPDYFWYK